MAATVPALDLKSIAAAYASGATSPSQLVQALYPPLAAAKGIFIHLAPLQQLLERAAALEALPQGSRGMLWGVPFATKDNVDVAGMPTTAACPSFSYVPEKSAAAVQALEDAGGKGIGGKLAAQGQASIWLVCMLTHQHVAHGCGHSVLQTRLQHFGVFTPILSDVYNLRLAHHSHTHQQPPAVPSIPGGPAPLLEKRAMFPKCNIQNVLLDLLLACVPRLCTAGGINFGKTNLDQFASGLVGTRTPYGTAANAFDGRFIPGGSSSGSAAAVGAGLLCFALGTDTAGSGRVPAGYNGCVGLKGTLGKISTVGEWRSAGGGGRGACRAPQACCMNKPCDELYASTQAGATPAPASYAIASDLCEPAVGPQLRGTLHCPPAVIACCACVGVVPACASLDCLTVFSRSVDDGAAIMAVMENGSAGPADVWRRSSPVPLSYSPGTPLQFKFGVPAPEFLEWAGPGERSRQQAAAHKCGQRNL
jgi:hypothetical protein